MAHHATRKFHGYQEKRRAHGTGHYARTGHRMNMAHRAMRVVMHVPFGVSVCVHVHHGILRADCRTLKE